MATKLAKSQSVEPGDLSPNVEGAEPATAGRRIKKAAAVRAALEAGHDLPEAGTSFVRDRFGLEISNQHFSAIKSNYLKKQREGGSKSGKAAAKASRKHRSAPAELYLSPPAKARTESEPDVLLALESIKVLVESYGADKVRRLVDLLS